MPLAMADCQHPRLQIHPNQEEPLLVVRVLGVWQDAGVWVRERIGRHFEAHSVYLHVDGGSVLISLEFYVSLLNHTDMIHIECI